MGVSLITGVANQNETSFTYKDKKLGMLKFHCVNGNLFCEDWGRMWKFDHMERNGEQWLYLFENQGKIREYNLPRNFIDIVFEKTGARIPLR